MKKGLFLKKFLLGDIHNVWFDTIGSHVKQFAKYVEKAKAFDIGNICYIQVGDFGIGHTNDMREDVDRLIRLDRILKDHLSFLYIIRGNHDDPSWFVDSNYKDVKVMFSNIKFVPDYSVLELDGENFLFVGGALSIDRIPNRFKAYPAYWKDEGFFLNEDKLKNLSGIDRVVTHNAPNFCPPVGLAGIVYDFATKYDDKTLIDELNDERKQLALMASALMFSGKNKIRSWAYGHFHRSSSFYHNNCEFVCLNINQFMQI